jgi:hypothetical protein
MSSNPALGARHSSPTRPGIDHGVPQGVGADPARFPVAPHFTTLLGAPLLSPVFTSSPCVRGSAKTLSCPFDNVRGGDWTGPAGAITQNGPDANSVNLIGAWIPPERVRTVSRPAILGGGFGRGIRGTGAEDRGAPLVDRSRSSCYVTLTRRRFQRW